MDDDFKYKLKNLHFALKDILDYFERCSLSRLDTQAEQALEIIYNFTDALAEIEESRYNSTSEDSFGTCRKDPQQEYEDFDYIDEEVDIFPEEDTENYADEKNDQIKH
ncbi:MAG: hypothetical protein Q8930_16860 [Bacillota bacterium]|nr:hypothetical protein [Bacillota bacterium]